MRKDERLGRWDASCAIFKTAVRAGFVYHVAVFAFEEMFLLFAWLRHRLSRRDAVPRIEDQKKKRRLLKDSEKTVVTVSSFAKTSIKNMIVCVAAILSEGLGASLGTLISPGLGTVCFARLGSNAAYFL